MRHTIATSTVETFLPYVGQAFRLVSPPGEPPVELSLTVEAVEDRTGRSGARGFSVVYTGDAGNTFQQGCLIIEHPDFDPDPVFFVRIMPPPRAAGQPMRAFYETIFA